jgi:hypothetical protein
VATENRDRSHAQLNESDRNMDSAQQPSDARSARSASSANSPGETDSREPGTGQPAEGQNASSRHQDGSTNASERARADRSAQEGRGGQRASGSSRNESVDSPAELSERGGIRPERTDPAEHADRSRDRDLS